MIRLKRKTVVLTVIIVTGIALRFFFASLGHNYDLESYKLVAAIVSRGGNVYAETARYNYGPIWSWILGALAFLANVLQDNPAVFRYGLTVILTGVDLGIFSILYKKFNLKAAACYFLNPVSFIVTGYYSQFDNFAILIGILAILVKDSRLKNRVFWSAVLLGISISLKQLLMFFPLWLCFREKKPGNKLIYLVIPYFIFLLLFLPYLSGGGIAGIEQNVFMYKSVRNTYFTQLFLFGSNNYVLAMFCFLGAVTAGAWLLKKSSTLIYLFGYCFLILIFSPSMLPYYFVLVLPLLAVKPNWLFVLFSLVTGFILCLNGLGPGWQPLMSVAPPLLLSENYWSEPFLLPYVILWGGLFWLINIQNKNITN